MNSSNLPYQLHRGRLHKTALLLLKDKLQQKVHSNNKPVVQTCRARAVLAAQFPTKTFQSSVFTSKEYATLKPLITDGNDKTIHAASACVSHKILKELENFCKISNTSYSIHNHFVNLSTKMLVHYRVIRR